MVPHLKAPILNGFYHLLWFYFVTVSEFNCLALLAKPYPVSGLAPLPQIPNQHHFIQKGAHEVRGAILVAWVLPVFTKIIYFVYKPLELCNSINVCLSAAPLCYTCFDCGRTYPDLIHPVPGLALHYLCVDLILSCGKSARFSEAYTRNEHK